MTLWRLLAFASLTISGPVSARAPTTPPAQPPACSFSVYHGLDFLLGEWRIVETANGKLFAINKVGSANEGCAIQEELRMVAGTEGISLNFYLPSDGLWHTIYHDSGGHFAHMSGAISDTRHEVGGQVRLPHDAARLRTIRQVTDRNRDGLPHQVGYLKDDKGGWAVLYDVTFCPAATDRPPVKPCT